MQFPTSPDVLVPHIDPAKDTGPWALALRQLPPGSTLMAASEWLTWPQWIELFGQVTGVKTSYKQTTIDDLDEHIPGGVGKEIGEMYEFSSKYAYNAFQMDTLKIWDLEKVYSLQSHTPVIADKYVRWALRCQRRHYGHISRKKTGSLRAFCLHEFSRDLVVKT